MSGDGDMHEVLKRLGAVETSVAGVAATMPHLATKASVDGILATIPHLATKADLGAMETRIIKWFIATATATAGLTASLAFSIAKFIH